MNITESQIAAINSSAPDIAVIAGPGSGKTTVLCKRIMRLIGEGILPGSMVAITFTNAAAREIEKRLQSMWRQEHDNHFPECEQPMKLGYAGTLHGYCLRLLKSHGKLIGLPSIISMLGEDEAHDLLEAAKADQMITCTGKELKEALALGPEYFLKLKPANLKGAGLVASAYYRQQLSSGVLDFDSVLKFAIMLLETMDQNVPAIVPWLFWDEVQDSGADDWRIMELIAAQNRFVVGDPDQSIYGFRGARPDLFLRYLKGSREVITLADNFRCLPEICETANKLIGHNTNRMPKRTESHVMDPAAGTVARWMGFDAEGELLALAQEITRLKLAPEQCAVLVRTNKLVERVSKSLAAHSIPVAKNMHADKPDDWGKARALISLLSNIRNDTLMYWWLVRQNGKRVADGLRLTAMKNRVSIAEAANFPDFTANCNASELPRIMAEMGLSQESIVLVTKAKDTLPDGASMTELAHALADEELHAKQEGHGVTVTTIHSAKGREWEAVFMLAVEDGILPSRSKSANIEEERRLAFVAITRAKSYLAVSNSNARRPMYGPGEATPATISPFIGEMGLATEPPADFGL